MFDLNPAAERLYQEFRETDPGLTAQLIAHTFLDWLGARIEPAPDAGDVMEFLWGYLPIYAYLAKEIPDDDRVALGTFLKFLVAKGFEIPGAEEVLWDKRTFARRFRSFKTVPFSLWAEELRLAVVDAGFKSTIPPADADDLTGEHLYLKWGNEGLRFADRSMLSSEGVADSELAERTKALERANYFVDYLGKGKRLTKKGNMALADGKALAEAFGEGFLFDQRIGEHVHKTRSSSEIESVDLTLNWTRAAGFVAVKHGRVSPTARGRRLGKDPLDDWYRLFRSFALKLRWVEKAYAEDRRPFWTRVASQLTLSYLAHVARRGSAGMALLPLAMETWEEFSAVYYTDHLTEEQVRSQISWMESAIRRAWFEPLADLGAAEVWLSAVEGAARLTSLGLWGLEELCKELLDDQSERPAPEASPRDHEELAELIMLPVRSPSPNGHRS